MPSNLESTIRDLHRRRGRERRGLTLAEGVRLVEEALATGVEIVGAVVSPGLQAGARGRELEAALRRAQVPVSQVADGELEQLAGTEHPQGVLAVVRPVRWVVSDVRPGPRRAVLVLDAVQDPGNVGTMLRTAHGLGAAGVFALPGTAELTNPKVLRASMGALFRLPCVPLTDAEWGQWTAASGAEVWVADSQGIPGMEPPRGAVALVVGNEGAGVRPETAGAGKRVAVSLVPGAESLNVGVAAGILLYEVMRER